MDAFYVKLGIMLQELRESKQLSLNAVSEKIGVSTSTLARYEKGAISLSVINLAKLSLIYEFNIKDFISGASVYLEERPNDSQENKG